MWHVVAKLEDLAPGGLKTVRPQGIEVTLGNVDGVVYAVSRRCGHMNAPMEDGTLDGYILTCPLHAAQFDIRSGAALSYPMPHHHDDTTRSPALAREGAVAHRLIWKIRLQDLTSYPVRLEGDAISVEL